MDVVTPTDRLKSVRNRYAIEVFGNVFVLSISWWIFCWCRGLSSWDCVRSLSFSLLMVNMSTMFDENARNGAFYSMFTRLNRDRFTDWRNQSSVIVSISSTMRREGIIFYHDHRACCCLLMSYLKGQGHTQIYKTVRCSMSLPMHV